MRVYKVFSLDYLGQKQRFITSKIVNYFLMFIYIFMRKINLIILDLLGSNRYSICNSFFFLFLKMGYIEYVWPHYCYMLLKEITKSSCWSTWLLSWNTKLYPSSEGGRQCQILFVCMLILPLDLWILLWLIDWLIDLSILIWESCHQIKRFEIFRCTTFGM